MTALQVIDQVTVTDPAGAASISLNSISGDFADLMVVFSGRTTISDNIGYGLMTLNGSGTGYTEQVLQGNSSTYAGSSATGAGINAFVSGGNNTSNTFGIFTAYLPKYSSSTNAKRVLIDLVSENNATGAFTAMQRLVSVYWNNTAAISSITFTAQSGVYVQNSTVTLYGIKEHNSLTSPKATGGIISYDSVNSKWVHSFTANGTFTPSENLTGVEYLVIAGGGGSGRGQGGYPGGAGGAGGYRSSVAGENSGGGASAESALSLTASTGYAVTVGGGGAASTGNGINGTNGGNSTFSTITSTGGGGGGYGAGSAGFGSSGGSGGGGGSDLSGDNPGGSGTSNQGYAGGYAKSYSGADANIASGGGGGAGSVGENAGTDGQGHGGDGGSGVVSYITGYAVERAGGGGGGSYNSALGTATGGGGTGSRWTDSTQATDGLPATGGGGGGGGSSATGAGGSGVVIVRYDA